MTLVRWVEWLDCDDQRRYLAPVRVFAGQNLRRLDRDYPCPLLELLTHYAEKNDACRTEGRVVILYEGDRRFVEDGFETHGRVEKKRWQLDMPTWHLWCDAAKLIMHPDIIAINTVSPTRKDKKD
jgi:hypothetical protein